MNRSQYIFQKHKKDENYDFSCYSYYTQDAICILAAYELSYDMDVETNKKIIQSILGKRYEES